MYKFTFSVLFAIHSALSILYPIYSLTTCVLIGLLLPVSHVSAIFLMMLSQFFMLISVVFEIENWMGLCASIIAWLLFIFKNEKSIISTEAIKIIV